MSSAGLLDAADEAETIGRCRCHGALPEQTPFHAATYISRFALARLLGAELGAHREGSRDAVCQRLTASDSAQ